MTVLIQNCQRKIGTFSAIQQQKPWRVIKSVSKKSRLKIISLKKTLSDFMNVSSLLQQEQFRKTGKKSLLSKLISNFAEHLEKTIFLLVLYIGMKQPFTHTGSSLRFSTQQQFFAVHVRKRKTVLAELSPSHSLMQHTGLAAPLLCPSFRI